MGKTLIAMVLGLLVGCASDEPPPSCQQAMTAYYGGGCAFIDLTTSQPISQQQATADCQSLAGGLSVQCEAALDEWLTCLSKTSPAMQCDCSREQMDVIQC